MPRLSSSRIHQEAAALAHGSVTSHGFVDGNKRTVLHLTRLLVTRSGYTLAEDPEVIAEALKSIARGEIGSDDLVEWFRERLTWTEIPAQIKRKRLI
ncbi:MAG: type II toxin-antitoxin system death-on-curing family toxin [Alphaproteobacteria bacterium]|nr:type II toxin-antitoxin system death-on-curing family toxin [Alphaproteobacteria bacterium]